MRMDVNNSYKPRVMLLNQALTYIKGHNNVILHYDHRLNVDVWTPNSQSKVPITLRRAVVKYSNELETLMHRGDVQLACRCIPDEKVRRAIYILAHLREVTMTSTNP